MHNEIADMQSASDYYPSCFGLWQILTDGLRWLVSGVLVGVAGRLTGLANNIGEYGWWDGSRFANRISSFTRLGAMIPLVIDIQRDERQRFACKKA